MPRLRDVVQRGLWFEEFEEGVRYLHRPGRTVTEADNVLFTTLTMNPQPLHLDAAWSAEQPFGQRLVNSMFTLSTLVGQSVGQLTQGTLVANLGFGAVAFPHPVFVGDTLYGESVVESKRAVGLTARAGRRDARAHRRATSTAWSSRPRRARCSSGSARGGRSGRRPVRPSSDAGRRREASG